MKPIFLSVLLILNWAIAIPNIITVTSNADSGPGTLRDAIQQAASNGTTITDTIVFNLPDLSRAGRTITPLTELPVLTSNIVIDGTTQPGTVFGVSDAKVIVLNATQPVANSFRLLQIINASNVQIYGLFILNTYYNFPLPTSVFGIDIKGSNNIIIGKPGKGNYFRGLYVAMGANLHISGPSDSSINVTIQSNICGNDENGNLDFNYLGVPIDPTDYAINFRNVKQLTIGGDQPAEGNTLSSRHLEIRSNLPSTMGELKIKNNFFSTPVTGAVTNSTDGPVIRIHIIGTLHPMFDYDVKILSNKISGALKLTGLGRYFYVQDNIIFDRTTTTPQTDFRIDVSNTDGGGMIGGDGPQQQNTLFSFRSNLGNYNWNIGQGSIVIGAPKVSILKNVLYCNGYYHSTVSTSGWGNPYVRVDVSNTNFASGKATPNTRIDLYIDDECSACEGKVYLGQTQSAADSTWSFTGTFSGTVVATATNSSGGTSDFSNPIVDTRFVKVVQPVCGQNNGSISNHILSGTWDNVEWHQIIMRNGSPFDTLISTNKDLTGVGPGNYYFISRFKQTCKSRTFHYTLRNFSPKIDTGSLTVRHPNCGNNNGSIFNIKVIDGEYSNIKWINEQGTVFPGFVSLPFVALNNVPPGKYKLIVTDTTVGCADSTFFYELINQGGPSLNTTNVSITNATCGLLNGSITNITASNITGTPVYRWVDSANNVVGTSIDLLNIGAGKYRLKFKDGSSCDTIFTPYYDVPGLGIINIDTSQLAVTSSQCAYASGTITGINVTGADAVRWVDATGQVVSQQLNPGFLYPGKYVLIATNQHGCTKQTNSITVPVYPFFSTTSPLQITGRPGTCDSTNGFVRVNNFPNPQNYTFRWVDSLNQSVVLSTTLELTGFNSGTFYLYAKDSKNCEQRVLTARLQSTPGPKFDESGAKVVHDVCEQRGGNIMGIVIAQGTGASPFRFKWMDENGTVIDTLPDIFNLTAGKYKLQVTDRFGCTAFSKEYIVQNTQLQLPRPLYDDQLIQRNTSVRLVLKNFTAGGWYQLYDAPVNGNLIAVNMTGQFVVGPISEDKTYYIQYAAGTCSSGFTTVNIKVFDDTRIVVPNAFSPNGDGINDTWLIKAEGLITNVTVQVYNRYGQLVFNGAGLNAGWDGRYKGSLLPSATYYWIVQAQDQSGKQIRMNGSVTLLR